MNSKMTPCEKLGYKVGDKFTVIKDSYFEKGTIVALSEDDGSEVPWFTCGGVRRALIIGSNPDVEPTPSKLKPAKQALADAIHQNGGWHGSDVWLFSTQSGDGVLKFWESEPKTLKGCVCTEWSGGCWHQTILSREEYYQAYPKDDADGWIEWRGGECPVDGDSIVDVEFNFGAGHTASGAAKGLSWRHEWKYSNIIKYRLHKPEVKPELCESVMRSIPEPESIDGLCANVTEENKHQHVDATTIEQLAQDYRNKLEYANRKQQEADAAKADADEKLRVLEIAGEAHGLLVTPITAKQEPEMVIAVQVGDEVECIKSNVNPGKYMGRIGTVSSVDVDGTSTPYLVDFGGGAKIWCHEVKFIRRP